MNKIFLFLYLLEVHYLSLPSPSFSPSFIPFLLKFCVVSIISCIALEAIDDLIHKKYNY